MVQLSILKETNMIESMNKAEAIAAMREGKIVTHEYFSFEEWMTIENGQIVLHDGERWSIEEFWKDRTEDAWQTGYSILE